MSRCSERLIQYFKFQAFEKISRINHNGRSAYKFICSLINSAQASTDMSPKKESVLFNNFAE